MAEPMQGSTSAETTRTTSPRPFSGSFTGRSYNLRPAFQHKFRSSAVKECIHEVLKEELASVQYNPEEIPSLTKSLSETIRNKLKEKGYHRYKIVVQVVIGEQRGEGVNMAARCFWDADTDNYAQDVFMNDTLFCAVVAFGCFFY
ncbi:dynein light chain Tctex-type protein 2B isoform X2 [Rhineura floridana]|uniref:dynein light chain Tctex-type protein 2B isoform X2 n=1 Tax=Rhineura floridana TaxID=261503 RepID=UPI002AC885CF|nr:dynein light chain Tctex-type protein 2B isoform X2 [Rhineura floridana]